jgi:hypothetical protein
MQQNASMEEVDTWLRPAVKRRGMKKYVTEYKLVRWTSAEMLVEQMGQCVADGWRVDTTRLGAPGEETGWTIYSNTYAVMPDINEALLPLKVLWNIVNSTEVFNAKNLPVLDVYTHPVVDEITKQVKAYYEKNAREMQ